MAEISNATLLPQFPSCIAIFFPFSHPFALKIAFTFLRPAKPVLAIARAVSPKRRRIIIEKQRAENWGKSVVEQLAKDLQLVFSGMQGFSSQNILVYAQFLPRISSKCKTATNGCRN